MPFEFTCPYCFKKTVVDEQFIGQQGPCVNCGKSITIPAPKRFSSTATDANIREHRQRRLLSFSWELRYLVLRAAVIVLTLLLACGSVYWLLWPSVIGLKQRHDVAACMNNLQRIAKALNNYAAQYGTYPPAIVKDSTGQPMYSWRVLLLPFLGEEHLYAQYDFDHAWNSPQNAMLMAQCPQVFRSPADMRKFSSSSSYMLITGAGTVFPPSGSLSPEQIRDGVKTTLLVVEVCPPVFDWTEPVDIDFSKLNKGVGIKAINAIGGNHVGGATAVFADGRAVWLPADTSPALLRSIITANGQEPINSNWFQGKQN